jgi:hypothetical protein
MIVDLETEVHTLEENADAYEIERLKLLQNIADMQHQVEKAGRGAGCSPIGYSSLTAATSGTGTPGGAAGSVRPAPDESGGTTATDPTSFTCG